MSKKHTPPLPTKAELDTMKRQFAEFLDQLVDHAAQGNGGVYTYNGARGFAFLIMSGSDAWEMIDRMRNAVGLRRALLGQPIAVKECPHPPIREDNNAPGRN